MCPQHKCLAPPINLALGLWVPKVIQIILKFLKKVAMKSVWVRVVGSSGGVASFRNQSLICYYYRVGTGLLYFTETRADKSVFSEYDVSHLVGSKTCAVHTLYWDRLLLQLLRGLISTKSRISVLERKLLKRTEAKISWVSCNNQKSVAFGCPLLKKDSNWHRYVAQLFL